MFAVSLGRRFVGALLLCACAGWASSGAAQAPVLLVVGDSLSAAYGIDVAQGWVAHLTRRLEQVGADYTVVNASISGETSGGGMRRLPAALERHRPAVVVIELGGNDGLRGIPPAVTEDNLRAMIVAAQDEGAAVVLVGMRLPPNLGPRFTAAFEAIFPALAAEYSTALVPFLLEGVATDATLMQDDGLHPTAAAQPRLLDNVWPHLRPLLTGVED